MKISAKENVIRQYEIPGLPYLVVLCFVAHKLVIGTGEDGRPYYENDQIRQKLIEDHDFTFIGINPDPDSDAGFDPDAEIAKICNYISKSSVELAVHLAEKSLNVYKRIIELLVKHF